MVKITSEEQNKVKRMKRAEDSLRKLWNHIKWTNIWITVIQEKEEENHTETQVQKIARRRKNKQTNKQTELVIKNAVFLTYWFLFLFLTLLLSNAARFYARNIKAIQILPKLHLFYKLNLIKIFPLKPCNVAAGFQLPETFR